MLFRSATVARTTQGVNAIHIVDYAALFTVFDAHRHSSPVGDSLGLQPPMCPSDNGVRLRPCYYRDLLKGERLVDSRFRTSRPWRPLQAMPAGWPKPARHYGPEGTPGMTTKIGNFFVAAALTVSLLLVAASAGAQAHRRFDLDSGKFAEVLVTGPYLEFHTGAGRDRKSTRLNSSH